MSSTTLASTSTSTGNTSKTRIRREDNYSGSILLSPSKKRRLESSDGYISHGASASHARASTESKPVQPVKPAYQSQRQGPPPTSTNYNPQKIIDFTEPSSNYIAADVFNWTFTPESIATCWIKDIMELTPAEKHDFWWIGKHNRIPCRTVHICGLVVGVKVDERQIRYTVDDGTAVIDCYYAVPRKPQPKKMDNITDASMLLPELPNPVAYVGHLVKVIGKPVRYHDTSVIKIAKDTGTVERCGYNEEPKHWATVRDLHESRYDLDQPFEVPKVTGPPVGSGTVVSSSSPLKENRVVPQTPSSAVKGGQLDTPSTVVGTPSTVHLSPEKPKSPQKLRHPSKLSSHNLTVNTFRIYVKHYMDNAPPPVTLIDLTGEDTEDEDSSILATPTRKSSRYINLANETPRPSKHSQINDSGKTPRPYIRPLSFADAPSGSSSHRISAPQSAPKTSEQMGFTLSYLRRVPVLAELARRVVRAEERRRAKAEYEERKKRESQLASSSTGSSKHASSRSASSRAKYTEDGQTGKRMKRLFQQVIVDMMKEGSIVLSDGPARPILPTGMSAPNESRMWKADSSTMSTATADVSVFSTASSASQETEEDVLLSEPDDNEESYLPLTSSFLATHIESIMRVILKQEEILKRQGKLNGGATKETILSRLKKDDRWRFLGEWHIEEALAWMKDQGRAWCTDPRRGKWEPAI